MLSPPASNSNDYQPKCNNTELGLRRCPIHGRRMEEEIGGPVDVARRYLRGDALPVPQRVGTSRLGDRGRPYRSERCAGTGRDFERDDFIGESNDAISDVFEIEIRLDPESIDSNGWPKVYEVGGRVRSIAGKWNIDQIDLHLYEDGACCLGIRYAQERNLTLERFLHELVLPFFYRLSYVDRFGLYAARRKLWGEYSHGDAGIREHESKMLDIARRSTGGDRACPCGSGSKYKRCCLDEVQAVNDRGQFSSIRVDTGFGVV